MNRTDSPKERKKTYHDALRLCDLKSVLYNTQQILCILYICNNSKNDKTRELIEYYKNYNNAYVEYYMTMIPKIDTDVFDTKLFIKQLYMLRNKIDELMEGKIYVYLIDRNNDIEESLNHSDNNFQFYIMRFLYRLLKNKPAFLIYNIRSYEHVKRLSLYMKIDHVLYIKEDKTFKTPDIDLNSLSTLNKVTMIDMNMFT